MVRAVILYTHTCLLPRCGRTWESTDEKPRACRFCRSRLWNDAGFHILHCLVCDHSWRSRVERPDMCPSCHSTIWDRPRQRIGGSE